VRKAQPSLRDGGGFVDVDRGAWKSHGYRRQSLRDFVSNLRSGQNEAGFIKAVKAVAGLNRKELFIHPIRHANRWLKKDNI